MVISKFLKHIFAHLDDIETLSTFLNSSLEQAKLDVEESLETFISKNIRKLGKATDAYFNCLNAFNAATQAEMEAKWKAYYRNKDLREAVDNLHEAEDNWNEFLRTVDKKLDVRNVATGQPVVAGSKAPMELPLFDIDMQR